MHRNMARIGSDVMSRSVRACLSHIAGIGPLIVSAGPSG